MEIKRTTEIFVETSKQFIVRRTKNDAAPVSCPTCGEPTLTAEQIAEVFCLSRRAVYQLIETGAAHFQEAETGAVMICLVSLREILDAGAKQLPSETTDNL